MVGHHDLCTDQHQGHDTLYLVIFKDTSLKTLSDLCVSHLQLLTDDDAF